ncbi:hypothetical protein CVT24_008635 [Panaeolus cyanescens]|uniref:Glucanase n=1 Tax=Panaeolus cyanescens TaxID=181874 RepID=A0A409WEH7_9AGAR|nr:hypothetical protein CVT24_008635 [Panaeolus cyanescens]
MIISFITCLFLSAFTVNADPGNPYIGRDVYRFPDYVSAATAGALAITNGTISQNALKVANTPNFLWIDRVAKIPEFEKALARASIALGRVHVFSVPLSAPVVQIVLYNIPGRDCASLTPSTGDFEATVEGVEAYKEKFIDVIVGIAKKYPTIPVVVILEPRSLVSLITSLSIARCANAASDYKSSITYALSALSTSSTITTYIDISSTQILTWPANIAPAAKLLNQLYQAAGYPASVRGFATNVGWYNYLEASPGDPYPNSTELVYVQTLTKAIRSSTSVSPIPAHAIINQARSGYGGISDTCNLRMAGVGPRPVVDVSDIVDAIVWTERIGVSDGSSFDDKARCGGSDSYTPSPPAGAWFQTYFEWLVRRANPEL